MTLGKRKLPQRFFKMLFAAADTVLDAKDRGLSDGQAFALGTAAGVTECVFSRLDLGVLFKGKWEKGAVRYILKNAGVDGGSSVAEELVNSIADTLIARDKSYWKQKLTEYEAVYGSEAEAFAHALSDELLRYGGIFLSGAAGGAAMAAGRTAIGYAANRFGGKGRTELPEGDAARAKELGDGESQPADVPNEPAGAKGGVALLEKPVKTEAETRLAFGDAAVDDDALSPESSKVIENRIDDDWNEGETHNLSTIDKNGLQATDDDDILAGSKKAGLDSPYSANLDDSDIKE